MNVIDSNRRALLCGLAMMLGLASFVSSAAEPAQKDAEALVRQAAAFLKANGQSKLLEAVNVKDGEFHKGEFYVFVYDDKATILAHPVNAKVIGKNTDEVPDPDGKYYRKDSVALAKGKGSGWVDYKYKNPASGKVEDTTSFILGVDKLILVASVYKD